MTENTEYWLMVASVCCYAGAAILGLCRVGLLVIASILDRL